MYCSSCGWELTTELSYCNRCGANLKATSHQAAMPPAKFTGAAWAISAAVALTTLGGLAMVFGLVLALVTRGIDLNHGGMALIIVSLVIILAIALKLVRQLSRVLDIAQLAAAPPAVPEIRHQPIPQIAATREPVASVTDHTTRTLEPKHRARET